MPKKKHRLGDPRPGAFDAEGDEYDYRTAKKHKQLQPRRKGEHWGSRVPDGPREGMQVKGKKHKSFQKAVDDDKAEGYDLEKRADGRYYTVKRKKPGTGIHPKNK